MTDEEEEAEDLGTAPAPEPPASKRGPLTEKGRILVAQAKTAAIRCALRDRRDHLAEDLLTVLVLAIAGDNVTVLGDPASKYARTRFADLASRLVTPEGTPRQDLTDMEIYTIAAEAAARMIVCAPTGAFGNESGPAAEWIGIALEAHLDMPRLDTEEILATLSADALKEAAIAVGDTGKGTGKAIRARLVGNAEGIRLPGMDFAAKGPPQATSRPEGHVGPFPCAGCTDPEYCVEECVCEAGGDAADESAG